jgi:peptidoglycan/LPS O-acetylase OafA/YrhL
MLRGFACILVLIQHIAWICPIRFIYNIVPESLLIGSGGVCIFFTISGFVVTFSLKDKLNEIKGDFFLDRLRAAKSLIVSFYKRRFFRIVPVMFFVIFLLGIFLVFTESDLKWLPALLRSTAEILLGTFNNSVELFLQKEKIHTGGIGPFWTLAVEAQFYMLWPLVLLLCKNDNFRAILSLLLGALMLFLIQPIISALFGNQYYFTHSNLSGLFLGSFLAYLYDGNVPAKTSKTIMKILSAFLAMLIWFYPGAVEKTFFSYMVVGIASFLIVSLAVFSEGSFNFIILNKIFRFLGSRSYSFYAVQLTLANITVWYTNSLYFPKERFYEYEFYMTQFIIYIVVLLFITELVYRFIEKPARRLGQS